jgi:hypothetical protein
LPSITTKVRLLNRLPTLDLAGRESCPIPVIHWGRPGPGGHGGQTLPKLMYNEMILKVASMHPRVQ